MTKPCHILVIRLSAMGDVAMTIPVLRAFLNQYPKVKLTVLTRPAFVPIFESLPEVEFLVPELKQTHKGFFGLYRLSKEIRALSIDAVADLHSVLRSNILKLFLYDMPFLQLNKGRKEKKALINRKNFHQLKSMHKRYAEVFEGLGYQIALEQPKFPKRHEIQNSPLASELADEKPLIGIAPFAAHVAKMYPLHLMEEVISDLSEKFQIVLFGGGSEEKAALERIESQYLNVISVAGRLSLQKELELISNLDLMISMDSANGHLAAIYGIKVLSIWGVTHPYAGFSPFNQPAEFSMVANREDYPLIPTSVYGNKYPKGYELAAGSISPAAVVNKVEEILA